MTCVTTTEFRPRNTPKTSMATCILITHHSSLGGWFASIHTNSSYCSLTFRTKQQNKYDKSEVTTRCVFSSFTTNHHTWCMHAWSILQCNVILLSRSAFQWAFSQWECTRHARLAAKLIVGVKCRIWRSNPWINCKPSTYSAVGLQPWTTYASTYCINIEAKLLTWNHGASFIDGRTLNGPANVTLATLISPYCHKNVCRSSSSSLPAAFGWTRAFDSS